MKKEILLGIMMIFTFFQSTSQIQIPGGINQNLMLISTKESDRMSKLEGSPYLQEDFQTGTAIVEGKEPLNVFLRYNVYQDQMEIKTNVQSEETYLLPKKESTTYRIGPETFVLDEVAVNGNRVSGYFVEQYNGQNLRLLKKPVATVSEAVKARTGYDRDKPASINIEVEYFVVDKNGPVFKVDLRHRDVKRTFESTRAKEYLSDHRIRSEEDLIHFVSFLDKQ